jgi:hypothetical protein
VFRRPARRWGCLGGRSSCARAPSVTVPEGLELGCRGASRGHGRARSRRRGTRDHRGRRRCRRGRWPGAPIPGSRWMRRGSTPAWAGPAAKRRSAVEEEPEQQRERPYIVERLERLRAEHASEGIDGLGERPRHDARTSPGSWAARRPGVGGCGSRPGRRGGRSGTKKRADPVGPSHGLTTSTIAREPAVMVAGPPHRASVRGPAADRCCRCHGAAPRSAGGASASS